MGTSRFRRPITDFPLVGTETENNASAMLDELASLTDRAALEQYGIAVSEPQKTNDREASVRVEYIYQDRNETQKMYLEKGPAGWKIARADSDVPAKTLIPYGTPVK